MSELAELVASIACDLRVVKAERAPDPLRIVERVTDDGIAFHVIEGRCPYCRGGFVTSERDGYTVSAKCGECRHLRRRAELFNDARFPGWVHRVCREWSGPVSLEYVENAASGLMEAGGKGRLWHGGNGRGKSFYGAAMALRAIDLGKSVRWRSWPDLMATLRDAVADRASMKARIEPLLRCDLLVLDELSGRGTDFEAETFEAVIGRRAEMLRPMLITTNLRPDAVRALVGDRVWSRLAAAVQLREIAGVDRRGETK